MARLSQLINHLIDSPKLSSLTRPEYKRIRITAYLSIVCVFIALVYCIADLSSGVIYSIPAYGLLILNSLGVCIFLRKGVYIPAKVLLMVTINLVVFYASITDPFEAGAFMLFMPAGIASYAILGFHQRTKGYLLTAFTSLLFFVSFFGDIEIGNSTPSEFYVKLSFVINYTISITSSIMILYFLVELNSESEEELIGKEKAVSDKNRELTKVNQELDRFVYSVSHDLRSPLSSILGITNLARHAESKEQLIEYMKLIEGRIKVQDQFIREIIDYSRNERTHIEREHIVFISLINEIIEALRFHPGSEAINFHIDDVNRTELVVDKTRLRIILSNLISNSIKYQDTAKPNRSINVSIKATGREHIISVVDNGIGIASEHVPKVFKMFYRASETSTGSGLGLFITQEAVDKIGGTISVESKIGEGTVFTVRIPL